MSHVQTNLEKAAWFFFLPSGPQMAQLQVHKSSLRVINAAFVYWWQWSSNIVQFVKFDGVMSP